MRKMSISFSRHTAHRAKIMKIVANTYAANAPFVFDATGGVVNNGVALSSDGTTILTGGAGNYRFSIFTSATPGVAGLTFSVKNAAPATTLAAAIPFGTLFEESFVLPGSSAIQLWFDSITTVGAGDTTMWIEVSM